MAFRPPPPFLLADPMVQLMIALVTEVIRILGPGTAEDLSLNSWYRTASQQEGLIADPRYNAVGNSLHLVGRAMDLGSPYPQLLRVISGVWREQLGLDAVVGAGYVHLELDGPRYTFPPPPLAFR